MLTGRTREAPGRMVAAEGDTLLHCPSLSLQMTAPLCREHCHHREGSVSLPLLDPLSPPPSVAELRERERERCLLFAIGNTHGQSQQLLAEKLQHHLRE